MSTLTQAIYKTLHRGDKTIEELADEMGCSMSILHRAGNPNDEADLQVKRLIPLMRATKDYQILRHLASACGFVVVKVPARVKAGEPRGLSEHQRTLTDYFGAMIDFFEGKITQEQALEHCNQALTEIAGYRKTVEKGRQLELEL